MPAKTPAKIKKRDGRIVAFDQEKITEAIWAAAKAVGGQDRDRAQFISDRVVEELVKKFKPTDIPAVEDVQDLVEKQLIEHGHAKTAKAYILYRDLHNRLRDIRTLVDVNELIGGYLDQSDWRVKENANMAYSLQGLNIHVSSAMSARYWLNKIYPKEVREAHTRGDFHLHDLYLLAPYCCGWDLQDLLVRGFGGVPGKIESKPAKHFRAALGQLVNFLYTLQGEGAGAEAVSNFDTLLSPFIRYDKLEYRQVKQALQEFLFNMNVPTRVGFQTPFTNVTMDLKVPQYMRDEPVIRGGQPQKEIYGDFQKEMDLFNQCFAELMMEGDAKGRVFTFPIPTYNITKDFDWENKNLEPVWEMTAKYGIPYFSNFINSDMKPEDARSMCCRLRLDNRQLRKRGGGLFGANPLTGSLGVVTINLPRIGYLSKSREEFFERLGEMMELARESLKIKRQVVEQFTENGLYPYSRVYLSSVKERFGEYWRNHFNTIGLIGGNEAALNLLGKGFDAPEAQEFILEILQFMGERLVEFQAEDDQMYNLEATPAESTAFRLAKKDKEIYPEIVVANDAAVREKGAAPYYTNSSQLPVGFNGDVFEALKLQDPFQSSYTGGTVFHTFLGERMPSAQATRSLVRKIAENFSLPYYTLTPTFSICPEHGYVRGEHIFCPDCKKACEVYSRVVGYLRPVNQWNDGKQAEFSDRRAFEV